MALADGNKLFAVAKDILVAIHASAGCRDCCKSAFFDGAVAIPTVHSQFPGVHGVTERDRLGRLVTGIGDGWCIPVEQEQACISQQSHEAHQQRHSKAVNPTWNHDSHQRLPEARVNLSEPAPSRSELTRASASDIAHCP